MSRLTVVTAALTRVAGLDDQPVADNNLQHVESLAAYRRIAGAARPGYIVALYVDVPGLNHRKIVTVRVEDR